MFYRVPMCWRTLVQMRRSVASRSPEEEIGRSGLHRPGHAVPRRAGAGSDPTTPPQFLVLPAITPLAGGTARRLALLENMSMYFEGAPAETLLGRVDADGNLVTAQGAMHPGDMWSDPVTENPAVGATEVWEFYNFTADAHPMHIHEVLFQVVNRQIFALVPGSGEVAQPVNVRLATRADLKLGKMAGKTRSSPTPARSPACAPSSIRRANSSGTATLSSTRTTK